MMPVKLAGCLLVIGAAALMGMRKGETIQNQYRQMKYLQRLLCMMESEIRYAHAHLGEVFRDMSGSLKEPYREWLLSVRDAMEEKNGGDFEGIWEKKTVECLKKSGLPEKELCRLSRLGGQLGASDLELQLRILGLYQEQLNLETEEIREEMHVRVRLCHCLGVLGGMLVAVLLI